MLVFILAKWIGINSLVRTEALAYILTYPVCIQVISRDDSAVVEVLKL